MSKQESKQAAAAGTVSPKQKRVRTKSRSSGERCMSDQSDTDMDTAVRSDQYQATPTPMLVDMAHSETAEQATAAGKFLMISRKFYPVFLSIDVIVWCDVINNSV